MCKTTRMTLLFLLPLNIILLCVCFNFCQSVLYWIGLSISLCLICPESVWLSNSLVLALVHLSVVHGLGGISAFYSCHPRYHWSIPLAIRTHLPSPWHLSICHLYHCDSYATLVIRIYPSALQTL
ncbi:uncharacterized protein LOC116936672 [Daphnia magna]|uniref:uncharacterized protein LOC116936672 n=1 Tax=Daphnia magna TaxID=35525 RepID=UPI001E1BBA0B|nr:uncharacterized protein LOC116936672 [Daphnia magna]